jgi:CubicO group peptidase (beta-lactamase class C family)
MAPWSEGFGYTDRERQILACPHTQFRTASVSKLLTTLAAAQLAAQGRLDLDAPIQRYVPSFLSCIIYLFFMKPAHLYARQLIISRALIRVWNEIITAESTQ